MEEDRVRRLAEVKSYLQRKVEELEDELELLKLLVNLVDSALSSESFTKASELPRMETEKTVVPLAPSVENRLGKMLTEQSVTSREGKKLASLLVYEHGIVVKPLMEVPVDSPPIRSFFIAKILEGYKRKDEELVNAGGLSEDEALDYEIIDEEGLIKEIRVINYRERRRLDELRSSLRWALNRVLERVEGR